MRRNIQIFTILLFIFISSNLSAGKPRSTVKTKPYILKKDVSGQKRNSSYPYIERLKRSLDQAKRHKEGDSTDSSELFKDHTKISKADQTRDRRGLSTEKFSSYQEVSEAGQAKSYNHPFDVDKQQIDSDPFWDNHDSSYTADTDAMTTFGKDVGVIKAEEPLRSTQERSEDSYRALPFWGNRGRHVNYLMGNSAFTQFRQKDEYPSWSSPEGRAQYDLYWSKGSRRQEQSRNLRYLANKGTTSKNKDMTTFWKNRERESEMQHLFQPNFQSNRKSSYAESNTMLNKDFYADQPYYIIVERSSRSSGEEDPFVISRGKKNANELDWIKWKKAERDRRGTIESLLDTDPFIIARGKKYNEKKIDKLQNMTARYQDIVNVKELVCSTIDLILPENSKTKRELIDRGEKNFLKALAAQLQNDPYYVSRGKREYTGKNEEESLKEFIEEMADLCN